MFRYFRHIQYNKQLFYKNLIISLDFFSRNGKIIEQDTFS